MMTEHEHAHECTTNSDRYGCPVPGCWWTATGIQALPGPGAACWRCKIATVATPGRTRADGMPADRAMFCDSCIDRCHEATDFAHVCQICASPEEARYYGWAVPQDAR